MEKEHIYPREFYVLIFTSMMIFLSVETTHTILPLHVTAVGASPLELGFVIGLVSFGMMIAKIPLGALSEKIPVNNILAMAAIGQSIVQWMYSVALTAQAFYPVQIIHAITFAPLVPVSVAISQNLAPRGRTGEIMGVYLATYSVASMIGSFLCSFLLTLMDYVQIFQVAALFPLVGLMCLAITRHDEYLKKTPGGDRRPSVISSLGNILRSRNMLILSYIRFSYSTSYAFFLTFFAVYAENSLFIPAALIAFLLGIRNTADTSIRFPVGKMLDRSDYRRYIVVGFLVLAVVYYLLSEVTHFIFLVALMAISGAMIGLRVVSEYTMLAEYSEPGSRSVTAAYLSTMFNLGAGFGAVMAGVLATLFGIPVIFKIAAIILLSAAIAAMAISKHA